ncbi:uncharacterized protein LOC101857754 [Aplysia californica]|uniref:Uncharacterized protein LOC101857754 n=1 Tax=Aplysia californica TaxID=6500 RepID=A0ABM0JA06_APLCA|nr:uncharacterized protein LOC101857754 [Aplysia californica]
MADFETGGELDDLCIIEDSEPSPQIEENSAADHPGDRTTEERAETRTSGAEDRQNSEADSGRESVEDPAGDDSAQVSSDSQSVSRQNSAVDSTPENEPDKEEKDSAVVEDTSVQTVEDSSQSADSERREDSSLGETRRFSVPDVRIHAGTSEPVRRSSSSRVTVRTTSPLTVLVGGSDSTSEENAEQNNQPEEQKCAAELKADENRLSVSDQPADELPPDSPSGRDDSEEVVTTTTTTVHFTNGSFPGFRHGIVEVEDTNNNNYNNNSISNNQTAESTDSDMGDNVRLEEKMRQFQNDNKKDENEDTRGTYNGSVMSEAEKQRRRNLIFDEERFEETFLKCLICREVYNEVDKLPKMLHCHHTFCLDCLLQMYRVEGEFRQSLTNVFRAMPMTVKIQCPTCREGIIISEPELRRLPNDHTIMELLYFVNQTGKNEVQYCTKHQMQPLNFFCEPCIMPVCCDCTVIDHKESKGHLVVNVDEAMKKYTPIVEETLGDIRTEKSSLAEKRLALENAQDDLDQIQKDLNYQIRSVFDSIRQVLDERERELYDVSESEIEKKREILDGHTRVLNERESQLNAEFNDLQKARDDRDISLIFTGHKSARDVLSQKVNVPTNSTKGFSVTFQFSSRADSVIKQQLGNLGDIIFQS